MADRVDFPPIAGVTWDDLDEDCDWEQVMVGNLTKNDVDMVLGKNKTARELQFMETENDLLIQLDKRRNERTPDFLELKMTPNNFVFVYGTLKQGGFYHNILDTAQYLGVGLTVEPNYIMKETASFPVVTIPKLADREDYPKKGKIRGEVYQVDPKIMLRLDELEGNGRMYTRRLVWVKLMDQMSSGVLPSIQVWMYIGNNEFFNQKFLSKVTPEHNGQHHVYDWDEVENTYAA